MSAGALMGAPILRTTDGTVPFGHSRVDPVT
jgi:hypothetical protein